MKVFSLAALTAVIVFPFAHADAASLPHSKFILPSTISVNSTEHTAVLPLHRGSVGSTTVWYILTDASDAAVAKRLGVVFAPDLAQIGNAATQTATQRGAGFAFSGAPDFSKTRTYVASVGGFPPKAATPGSVADDTYSPFVRVDGIRGIINAPIVATGDGAFDVTTHANTEDRVIAVDPLKRTVTLVLARGFFNNKPVYYISPDASDPVAAAVERATYVPRLAKANANATIPIGVVVNGALSGAAVQGLDYLALRTPLDADATTANANTIGSPFNLLSQLPDRTYPYASNAYSPLWAAFVAPSATKRLTNFASIAPIGKLAGFVVNCPVIAFGDDSGY